MIYTKAQLTAAGAAAGNLYTVGFDIVSAASTVMQNFTIRMGHTTASTLNSFIPGLSTVYAINYQVPGTGWQDISLTTPFAWDGISNVVVEICFGINGSYTSNSTVRGTTVTGRTWHYHADNYAGCTGTSTGTVQTTTPNIRFRLNAPAP
jgi:hypothetical protein